MRFTESQHFPDWIRYGIFLFNLVIGFLIFQSGELSNPTMILVLFTLCIPSIILLWTQITEIDSTQIYISVKPFIKKQIPFADIQSWTIRTYRPIMEYGGWGIRFGKNGTAYNIRGNKGLQLVLANGKKLLIGTQKDIELTRIMRSICPEKEI